MHPADSARVRAESRDMTTTAAAPSALDRFLGALHKSPMTRSNDRLVAGVCGALAERLGVAPRVVRIAALVLMVLGPGLPLYLVAWLLLPDRRGRVLFEDAVRRGKTSAVLLLIAAAFVSLEALRPGDHHGFPWILLAIGAACYVIRGRGGRRGRPGGGHLSGGATAYQPGSPLTGQVTQPTYPSPYGATTPYATPQDASHV